jgi:hypothetical protein
MIHFRLADQKKIKNLIFIPRDETAKNQLIIYDTLLNYLTII